MIFKDGDNLFTMGIKSVLLLLTGTVIGFLALLLVYSLPREHMKEHVLENADFLQTNYMLIDNNKSTFLDIATDTTILSEAICPSTGNLISDTMLAPRRRLKENNDDFRLTANYTCEDENLVQSVQYPRYWHGYLVIIKPLLIFFSVANLHLIYFFIQSILLFLLLIYLAKKNQTPLAICFGIGVLIINPMVTALNFQNASIYFTLLLSILFLICSGKLEKNYLTQKQCLAFFQIIGMAVAYFDFLTYPIVALGMPLLFLLYFSDDVSIQERMKYTILHSVMFFIGYFGMYFCKWTLATFLTDVNVFKDAYDEIKILLNANNIEGAEITIASGMAKIFSIYTQAPYLLLIIGGIIYAIMASAKAKRTSIWLRRNIPVILVALYPFCHILAATHTYYHPHFVYREFSVTILAVLFIILDANRADT